MRLAVEVGQGCERLMDEKMRGLTSKRIRVDEIWSYVGKHQRLLKPTDDRSQIGDMWTFVTLDADTKLVPCYYIGKRRKADATVFMNDLAERLTNRVQISADALKSYIDAVEVAFGTEVDFGQSVKFYEAEPIGPGRYSPPKVVRAERHVVAGKPDQKHISTSLMERQNSPCGWGCAASCALPMLSARRRKTTGRLLGCISRIIISCASTRAYGLPLLWQRAFLIGCGL